MTQPPEASAAPVSEAAPQALPAAPAPNRAPDDTEATAELLADSTAFRKALLAELAPLKDGREIRAAAVARIAEARAEANAVIEARLAVLPRAARKTVHRYADLTDGMVLAIFDVATQLLHPMQGAADGEAIAVLAVGGYGRAEMSPHSDVDLLLLTPWKITPWAESVIESMLYMLWDLKLKVGHSCRTVKDCLRLGREDYTIRTALLEHRFIAGNSELAESLQTALRTELFRGTEAEFIEAKLAERAERHRRQGGMRYVLEPNVKEGKGGLRDLQALYWIAKYIHQVKTAADLVDRGVFTRDEYDTFAQAEDFLWAVRCHMHLITGRATDQLTFDLQVEVARRMRYEDTAARRAVEYFMQDYFRHATKVGELTRVFLTALEAQHMKRAPMLERLFRRRKKLKPGYLETGNRLGVVDPKAFLERPIAFLELFEEALRTGLLIHPDAMRLVAANLDRIDDTLRQDPVAGRIFLDLLLKHGNPERALRRMNELGVLAAYIPEFEPIVAMMQFNVYHHYTVDEHIIQCISTLAQIERGELAEELPLSTKIVKEGINRRVLYIALLLHDIGKGRPEDHSILGAQIARKVAPRLGLSADECETVEWLVRSHLLMSDMAQKRDLSDPRTVRDFAKLVKTRKRLDLLTVLTVCDIRGVGPGTWNNWKAMLIRRLHSETAAALETGLEAVNRDQREDQAKRALREALSTWDQKDVRAELARHYAPYWQGLSTESHV
ncbi:[protein-PII] uridylyltransferase, partial [Phaeovulum sp.]|uniref:[protein-PII] uridylyltransferase n=1 Tax=Phaeovulum sp. TaxID=2934796 RepID=UPI00356ABC07